MFFEQIFRDPVYFANTVVVVIFSVSIHEFFHAWAAQWQGDDTAARQGRLSLNPLAHISREAILMLVLFGLTWGSTPINRARFRHAYSPAIVSFAGPFANLLLMAFSILVVLGVRLSGLAGPPAEALFLFFSLGAFLNAFLFVFNMLPIPPLDGFGVLETLVPPLRHYGMSWGRYGFLILLLLFLTGLSRYLSVAAEWMVASATVLLSSFLPV